MLYYLEQGPTEKTIIAQCVRQRLPLPDKIANAPFLLIGLELFWIGFLDLTSDRIYGGDGVEGPIPWSKIEQWAFAHSLSEETKEDLHYHMSQMDEIYLAHKAKKLSQRLKSNDT